MSTDRFTLIVPMSSDKPDYEHHLPYIFSLGTDGLMLGIKSITGLDLSVFTDICFTVLSKHAERYDVATMLTMQLQRLGLTRARIIVLDSPTRCQAETVARTIETAHIEGSIFIKDADGYFECTPTPRNGIAIYPLESMEMVDPRNKSYVAVDDMHYITNIIEHRVISHYFNAGGYAFADADTYLSYYRRYADHPGLCLSHIVYAMLLDKHLFRPLDVRSYRDWGTRSLYQLSLHVL